nr:MAG TPA: hypothetical protein [Caudoviricetes sp.]
MNPEYRHGLWDFLRKNFNPAKAYPYPVVAGPSRGCINKGRGGWKFVAAECGQIKLSSPQSDLALLARLG